MSDLTSTTIAAGHHVVRRPGRIRLLNLAVIAAASMIGIGFGVTAPSVSPVTPVTITPVTGAAATGTTDTSAAAMALGDHAGDHGRGTDGGQGHRGNQ